MPEQARKWRQTQHFWGVRRLGVGVVQIRGYIQEKHWICECLKCAFPRFTQHTISLFRILATDLNLLQSMSKEGRDADHARLLWLHHHFLFDVSSYLTKNTV